MKELPVNILEFLQRSDLLNDHCHSAAQLACLKALYGLSLNPDELDIYKRATGCDVYDPKEQEEITIIAGRRSGKTGKIAAPICVYESFRDHGVPPGEESHVMLLAPTINQAKVAFRCILTYVRRSTLLSKRVVRITKDAIVLDNRVVIACHPAVYDNIRGRTVVAAVCDEIGFWSSNENSTNAADEVIAALRPSMATVHNAKLIKISTPYGKEGLLWEEFQRRAELDFPVFQLATQEMNPTIDPKVLERERRRDPERFCREFGAEFTDSINPWITAEILEPCIVRGRHQLPHLQGVRYAAALDPASRHNDFALAVLHVLPSGMIVVDHLARWAGTKTAPLAFERVLGEVKDILSAYEINSVIGDQFYFDAISQYLSKLGIYYQSRTFGANTRAQIFGNLKFLLIQGKIELLDHPDLLSQLRSLQEEKTPRGQIDIRPFGSGRDDLAVALALAANELTKSEPILLAPQLGIVEIAFRPRPKQFPGCCDYEGGCFNWPSCLDAGHCQGFVAE